MKIREYAEKVGHEVVGKLTRHPELERPIDEYSPRLHRFYMDEAGNEYLVSKTGVCIIDAEGGVI